MNVLFSIISVTITVLFFSYIFIKYIQLKKENNEFRLTSKQHQEENAALAEELKSIIEQLDQLSIVASETDSGVLIMNNAGIILWSNDGFARLNELDWEATNEMNGKAIFETSKNDNINSIFQQCVSSKASVIYQTQSTLKSGKNIWTQTTLTPIIKNDEILKIVAIDSDITRLKAAEELITMQRDLVEEQNQQIKSSIRYALTIQNAILPSVNEIIKYVDTFIIYKPKDIVSGDFYWFSVINSEIESMRKIFLAVVDCTGHGVPGAFMSIMCHMILNEIVNEKMILSPNDILTNIKIAINKALKQDETNNRDGMDISLCKIEKLDAKTRKITFAAAYQSLFYYEYESSQIQVIKGDRLSIGGLTHNKETEFTNQELMLSAGDILYLTSDGFIDQNNKGRKRLGTGKVKEIFQHIAPKILKDQKSYIETFLYDYMDDEIQRDDITIMGIAL